MQCLGFAGEHAHLASDAEVFAGIGAACKVFSEHRVDPADCALAAGKVERNELLTRDEALLCVIWDAADEAAFRAVTLGWLARDVDIRLVVKQTDAP